MAMVVTGTTCTLTMNLIGLTSITLGGSTGTVASLTRQTSKLGSNAQLAEEGSVMGICAGLKTAQMPMATTAAVNTTRVGVMGLNVDDSTRQLSRLASNVVSVVVAIVNGLALGTTHTTLQVPTETLLLVWRQTSFLMRNTMTARTMPRTTRQRPNVECLTLQTL